MSFVFVKTQSFPGNSTHALTLPHFWSKWKVCQPSDLRHPSSRWGSWCSSGTRFPPLVTRGTLGLPPCSAGCASWPWRSRAFWPPFWRHSSDLTLPLNRQNASWPDTSEAHQATRCGASARLLPCLANWLSQSRRASSSSQFWPQATALSASPGLGCVSALTVDLGACRKSFSLKVVFINYNYMAQLRITDKINLPILAELASFRLNFEFLVWKIIT